jgi:hypothetical protein
VTGVNWSTACGGSSCVGADVRDTTAGTQFWIVRDMGSGTAWITQQYKYPVTPAGPQKPPVAGDLITVGRPVRWYPVAVDIKSIIGSWYVSEVTVVSPLLNVGWRTYFNEVSFATGSDVLFNLGGEQATPYVTSSFGQNNSYQFGSWVVVGGAYLYDTWFANRSILDGDVMLFSYLVFQDDVNAEDVYFDSSNQVEHSRIFFLYMYHNTFYGDQHWWGPGRLTTYYGSRMAIESLNGALTWTKNVLTTGGFSIDNGSTGCSFDLSTGEPIGCSTVTPAAIDASPTLALTSPQTGSGFLSE